MARGLNEVKIIGNVGNDVEFKATANSSVVNLSIGTDEGYKDKQTGQMVPKTEWHRVVIFGRLAEVARDYVKKGSKLYLSGKLQTRKWQDQQGQDRYTTEIVANEMIMLDKKDNAQAPAYQAPAPAYQAPTQSPTQAPAPAQAQAPAQAPAYQAPAPQGASTQSQPESFEPPF